jgi:hypothetical protein
MVLPPPPPPPPPMMMMMPPPPPPPPRQTGFDVLPQTPGSAADAQSLALEIAKRMADAFSAAAAPLQQQLASMAPSMAPPPPKKTLDELFARERARIAAAIEHRARPCHHRHPRQIVKKRRARPDNHQTRVEEAEGTLTHGASGSHLVLVKIKCEQPIERTSHHHIGVKNHRARPWQPPQPQLGVRGHVLRTSLKEAAPTSHSS